LTDWNPVTIEQGKSGDKLTTYRASKTYAENAGWSFVEQEKPGFDLVTLNPPMVYGPVINDQTIASLNTSNQRIWKYLDGEIKEVEPMGMPIWVDVRDLADAHLAAYEKPNAGGKRFFIVADALYSYQELADILRKVIL
jgi:nucleoside-diphosphate-sugar epimerase